jgi:uncharacterized coiled-coil protein SlyX
MFLSLQLVFCGVVVLAACFIAGKKLGERNAKKTRADMKAYELAFNQLIEQMERVAGHNIKVMETKTGELRELIPIIDKKLLYAHDLLSEIDQTTPSGKGALSAQVAEPPIDLKFRRDLQDVIHSLKTRLTELEQRLKTVESNDAEKEKAFSYLADQLSDITRKMESLPQKLHAMPIPTPSPAAVAPEVRTPAVFSPLPLPTATAPSTFPPTSMTPLTESGFPAEKITRLQPHPVLEPAAGLEPSPLLETSSVRDLRPAAPKPGSVLHDVIALHNQGITLPQIARRLNMDHGEVEVIMNIYGSKNSRPPLRKVT